jgi:hypothetical protein
MIQKWEWIALALSSLIVLAISVLTYVKRTRRERMFRPDVYHELSSQFEDVTRMHDRFVHRRRGDFFDKWGDDIHQKFRDSGATVAIAHGLWDVLTLGGSARRRAKANELEAAAYLAQSMEDVNLRASENMKTCVASTAARINHGFKLLRASRRIIDPLISEVNNDASPALVGRFVKLEARVRNLSVRHTQFLEIATAAGAGTATAVGLWGAVQVAGYASTHTAMLGLYGAAAHNAGWAWFGGGSLATGGGGMALGHVILPGVGIAVTWGVLITRLHQVANQMEKQISEIEHWNNSNMPVLTSFVAVEQKYRLGAEEFRSALDDLDFFVRRANRKLRPFGIFSDWRRKRRASKGGSYYSADEVTIVDALASTVDTFLSRLPVSHMREA